MLKCYKNNLSAHFLHSFNSHFFHVHLISHFSFSFVFMEHACLLDGCFAALVAKLELGRCRFFKYRDIGGPETQCEWTSCPGILRKSFRVPRRDSNLDSSGPESDALTTRQWRSGLVAVNIYNDASWIIQPECVQYYSVLTKCTVSTACKEQHEYY